MIRLFGQTDKTFTSNGDIVIKPLKAKVTKKDNGDYCLDIETGLEYVDYFVEGNIIVANTPTGNQAFRIGNVIKNKSKIVSKCWHVFYDSENYLIADSYVENKNCNDALNHLNNATEPLSEFTVSSNVTKVDSFRCVRKSLYEAIQTILERWGGHLVRNNFNIEIKSSIGQDNGIIVQYKKNLKEITCQENWDNVVTKLLPVGKDGILLNEVNPSASIYVTSNTQYQIPYTKTVTFTQEINEDDYPTEQEYKQALVDDLMAQAMIYVTQNSLPQVNYTLKANLEKVTDIGDVIEVIDDRLSVHMTTSVIGFVYDCISGKYTEVEFGNFAQTLSGLVGNITTSVTTSVAREVSADIDTKADKVIGATNGHFAGLDSTGNLTDSGKSPSDLLSLGTTSSTAYRGDRGQTAYDHATDSGRLTTSTATGLYKVGSTAQGHISALDAVTKADITNLGIPAQDTTYQNLPAQSGGTDVSLVTTGEKYTWNNAGGGGHVILDGSGTAMAQREKLQLVGGKVSDDSANNKTIFTVARELTQAEYDALSTAEKNNGTTYYILDAPSTYTGVPQSMIGDAWVINHLYAVGDYAIDANGLYKNNVAHTSNATNRPSVNQSGYWTAVTVAGELRSDREVEIYQFTGTTSLLNGYQRLATKTLSETWTQLRNKYRYILIIALRYSTAQTSAEYGQYYPATSLLIPTDKRTNNSGSNYVSLVYLADLASPKSGVIQLGWYRNQVIDVDLVVFDSSSTTYQVGYAIYGIK